MSARGKFCGRTGTRFGALWSCSAGALTRALASVCAAATRPGPSMPPVIGAMGAPSHRRKRAYNVRGASAVTKSLADSLTVVTGEPAPGRLALPELEATVAELDYTDSVDLLNVMVAGQRLKDISDLPLDLAV